MISSGGFANPGMSLWVFLGLGRLFAVADPPDLARAVQLLNVAALLLLTWIACCRVAPAEREAWRWATALAAVHPLLIVFHRKIWPPSVMPLLSLLLLLGWWRREKRGGAFAWGLLGAVLGQIHLSGFFFTGGLALWAGLFDRRRVRWPSWLAGNILGGLPLLPWALQMASHHVGQPITNSGWWHFVECKFWLRWIVEPFGSCLSYSLENDFNDFLRYPLIAGRPTYLTALLHGLLALVGIVVMVRAASRLWQERQQWRQKWIGRESETAFTQSAALWGFGILLTFSTMPIHRHYLMIAFPLGLVWLARMALVPVEGAAQPLRWGRVLLAVVLLAELGLSICFQDYIRANQRTIAGDYYMPYRAQPMAQVLSP
jgi:hypothetical protein